MGAKEKKVTLFLGGVVAFLHTTVFFKCKGVMFVYILLSNISFTKFDRRFSCCRINNNSVTLRKNL